VLSNPNSFDVAVTTYEMVNSADFGRPIQTSIVSGRPAGGVHQGLVCCCRERMFLCYSRINDAERMCGLYKAPLCL
jgi:hypothetical protein